MNLMNPKLLSAFLLASLASAMGSYAVEETLPPLKDGKLPKNLEELWAGYDPRKEPLQTEILKEWEEDGVVCRLIRYQVGIFKGAPAKVAAFYGFPKNAAKLPALVQIHGGGQSASLDAVITDAKRGYCSVSINWGGNKLNFGRSKETYTGPQTDWGKLDATHPPQRNKINHFAGPLTPDAYTLDSVESPRNSNWFIVMIAARRAITFLEQQPEADPSRIGVYGHSMGGKLTTDVAGIDQRIKAAVPSCGGSGDILESQSDLPGCIRRKITDMELACISDNAYIPKITCPVLWHSPTNDFHAPIENMAWNWRGLPDRQLQFSISAHLNHRHTDDHAINQLLWFEQYLKGVFRMPKTPAMTVNLKNADGVPTLTVTPDASMPVVRVDVYYSIDPHPLTRFWRDALAVKTGSSWTASCPIMSPEQPFFAYADVIYDTPEQYRKLAKMPGSGNSATFAINSRVLMLAPAQLQAAGVKSTDRQERLIDDGTRGWHDWYRLNWDHAPLWHAVTRKLKDVKWRGPDGGALVFEIKPTGDNTLVVSIATNTWGAFYAGKPAIEYTALKEINGTGDWQTVSITPSDLASIDPKNPGSLANWQSVTELGIGPSGEVVKNGKIMNAGSKPWVGSREIRNLHWEGGTYSAHQTKDATLSAGEHQKAFNEAIRKSLEQEKIDRKSK